MLTGTLNPQSNGIPRGHVGVYDCADIQDGKLAQKRPLTLAKLQNLHEQEVKAKMEE